MLTQYNAATKRRQRLQPPSSRLYSIQPSGHRRPHSRKEQLWLNRQTLLQVRPCTPCGHQCTYVEGVRALRALTPALLVTLHRLMQVRQHALAASRSRQLLLQPPSSRHLPRLLRRDRRRRSCRLQRATKATATRLITGVSACTTLSRYLHTAVTYTPSVLRLLHTPHHMLSYTYAPQRHLHTAVTYTLLSPTTLHL